MCIPVLTSIYVLDIHPRHIQYKSRLVLFNFDVLLDHYLIVSCQTTKEVCKNIKFLIFLYCFNFTMGLKGTLTQIWKYAYIFIFIWTSICWSFQILHLLLFGICATWDMWNVCLQTIRNNRIYQKLGYFLGNVQTSLINNSIIFRIWNAKFAGYFFYINTNI